MKSLKLVHTVTNGFPYLFLIHFPLISALNPPKMKRKWKRKATEEVIHLRLRVFSN